MAKDLSGVAVKALTRPGVGAAFLAGLGVYLVFVVPTIVSTLVYVATDRNYGQDVAGYLALMLPVSLPGILLTPVPLALGVFLSFWQLAPIAPQLRMAHVVTRALLAAIVGALLSGVLAVLLVAFPRLFGQDAQYYSPLRAVSDSVMQTIPGVVDLLFDAAIAVPLAALLLWGWMQRHLPDAAPRGALDEV